MDTFLESTFARGWRDTSFAIHTRWFWFVEIFAIAPVGAIIGAVGADITETKGLPAIVIPILTVPIGALIFLLIFFLANLIASPFRQRNEARNSLSELRASLQREPQVDFDATAYTVGYSANIQVRNMSEEPITVSAKGFIFAGTVPIRNVNREYVVKWQGTDSEIREIGIVDSAILNVAEVGIPPQWNLPFLGKYGTKLCINFLTAASHTPKGFFSEGCISPSKLPRNGRSRTDIQMFITLRGTLKSDPTKAQVLKRPYRVQFGTTRDSIVFEDRSNPENELRSS